MEGGGGDGAGPTKAVVERLGVGTPANPDSGVKGAAEAAAVPADRAARPGAREVGKGRRMGAGGGVWGQGEGEKQGAGELAGGGSSPEENNGPAGGRSSGCVGGMLLDAGVCGEPSGIE